MLEEMYQQPQFLGFPTSVLWSAQLHACVWAQGASQRQRLEQSLGWNLPAMTSLIQGFEGPCKHHHFPCVPHLQSLDTHNILPVVLRAIKLHRNQNPASSHLPPQWLRDQHTTGQAESHNRKRKGWNNNNKKTSSCMIYLPINFSVSAFLPMGQREY